MHQSNVPVMIHSWFHVYTVWVFIVSGSTWVSPLNNGVLSVTLSPGVSHGEYDITAIHRLFCSHSSTLSILLFRVLLVLPVHINHIPHVVCTVCVCVFKPQEREYHFSDPICTTQWIQRGLPITSIPVASCPSDNFPRFITKPLECCMYNTSL